VLTHQSGPQHQSVRDDLRLRGRFLQRRNKGAGQAHEKPQKIQMELILARNLGKAEAGVYEDPVMKRLMCL
jgi:hypothetical protein